MNMTAEKNRKFGCPKDTFYFLIYACIAGVSIVLIVYRVVAFMPDYFR
jgi:hypothetical protein